MLHVSLVLPVPALCYMSWELTLASSYNTSSVLQQHTAGFIAFSLCSLSCLASGPRQKMFAPQSTGSTCCLSTTLHELGVNSEHHHTTLFSVATVHCGVLLHSLSARTPVYQGRFRRGLHHVALALQVPALRYMSWELTLASSYNPRQSCNGALRTHKEKEPHTRRCVAHPRVVPFLP